MAALAFGAACVAANTLIYMRRRSCVVKDNTHSAARDVLLLVYMRRRSRVAKENTHPAARDMLSGPELEARANGRT